MPLNERVYTLENLLKNRQITSFSLMQERTGASRATIYRDIQFMRDRLRMPIVFDQARDGYRLEGETDAAVQTELPGLWFKADEIHALLTMQQLISGLDRGGLLGRHLEPLMARLKELLASTDHAASEVQKRIKVLGSQSRHLPTPCFTAVGSALLRRKRLLIRYRARYNDKPSEREISPQRLVHYRDNWYLDAWCHLRNELRCFATDAIEQFEILGKPAKNVSARELDAILGSGYGIFSGRKVQWAKLRFGPERARWVRTECWHPDQKSTHEPDGSYLLEIPYAHPQELVMDILRQGADVEVIAPDELRAHVATQARAIAGKYAQTSLLHQKTPCRHQNNTD